MHDETLPPSSGFFSRRGLIAGAGAAAVGVLGSGAGPAAASATTTGDQSVETWIAKQQVAELRRLYARATDLIGMATDDSIAEGRAIYHRVFTPDARIGAAGVDPATGPDAWVDVVLGALADYDSTQHLIGTQLVNIATLPDAHGEGGRASMTSYLQAWHATAEEVWIFIGTYNDGLAYSKNSGWQIQEMMLEQISGERRAIGN